MSPPAKGQGPVHADRGSEQPGLLASPSRLLLLVVSGVSLLIALLDVATGIPGLFSDARAIDSLWRRILWLYAAVVQPPYLIFCLLTALGRVPPDRLTSWGRLAHPLVLPALLAGSYYLIVVAGLWYATVRGGAGVTRGGTAAGARQWQLSGIVAIAVAWSFAAGAITTVLVYLSPLLGPSAYMTHPFDAMVLGLGGACIALLVALVLQVRRVLALSTSDQVIHLVLVVALALVPVRVALPRVGGVLLEALDNARMSREVRMSRIAPLTEAERALRDSTHFDMTVVADDRRLARDLEATGLFDQVVWRDEMPTASLVATSTERYVRPMAGQAFRLAASGDVSSSVTIDVVYRLGGDLARREDREQYLDRLAVELIAAVNRLVDRSDSNTQTGRPAERARTPVVDEAVLRGQATPAIQVWSVGSPHRGDIPASTIPSDLQDASRDLGYDLFVQGFPAVGFADVYFDAFVNGNEPDILAIGNYGIIDGITTDLGSFTGLMTNDRVRGSLISVLGGFESLEGARGGWQFLASTSRNHEAAKALALRTPTCLPEWRSATSLPQDVSETVQGFLSAYLSGSVSGQQEYEDADRLLAEDPVSRQVRVSAIVECGHWGNHNLMFVPVRVSVEFLGPNRRLRTPFAGPTLGQETVLLVLRRGESGWRVLAAARDPVTTEEFVANAPRVAALLRSVGVAPPISDPPEIVSPPDGESPTAAGSRRFGEFIWTPSRSEDVVVEIVEFAYADDVRLFLRSRMSPTAVPQQDAISGGRLWRTESQWRWRVWAVAWDGSVTLSEARTFEH